MARICKENRAIDVLPLGVLPWPTKLGTNGQVWPWLKKRFAKVSDSQLHVGYWTNGIGTVLDARHLDTVAREG
jgi:hypothetical protein